MHQIPVTCPVCGGHQDKEFLQILRRAEDGSGGSYRVAQCRDCGFLFVNPRPTPAELLALYASHVAYFREEYEPLSLESPVLAGVLRDIQAFVSGGSLLEVGCGRGELLELARKSGFQVYGCDLQRAPSLDPGISVHLGDLSSSSFLAHSFDCVVIRNTLEHLFDPGQELKTCARLLKPGGFLYLKVPNGDYEHGWRCRLMLGQANAFGPPWHLNYFTETTLHMLLRKNGFEIADWVIESPTPDSRPFRNLFQGTAVAAFRALRLLTLGRAFPKPLLTSISRKIPVPADG